MAVVRRRRLGRGESMAEVEGTLRGADLVALAALALFDDVARADDVLPHLGKAAGRDGAEAFRLCHERDREIEAASAIDLVRRASKLTAWLQGLH